MRKMFMLSALLRRDHDGRVNLRLQQGYRLTMNEDEAVGSFVAHCRREAPDFAIGEVVTLEVDPAHVAMLAAEQAAAASTEAGASSYPLTDAQHEQVMDDRDYAGRHNL